MFRFLSAAAVVVLTAGCAFTPQAVVIKPKIDVVTSEAGKDLELPLTVVDERPRQTIGTRGARGVGADMTIEGSLAEIVREAVAEGLAAQKFRPTRANARALSNLRIEIRSLDYGIAVGFWAGTLKVDVALKAICSREGIRSYEMLYRGEHAESVQVVQSTEANNSYVSSAVSQAINFLLKDEQLSTCLAP